MNTVKPTTARPTAEVAAYDKAWSPSENPALAALLDHLAEELALEYIRLMEVAAQNARATPSERETEDK